MSETLPLGSLAEPPSRRPRPGTETVPFGSGVVLDSARVESEPAKGREPRPLTAPLPAPPLREPKPAPIEEPQARVHDMRLHEPVRVGRHAQKPVLAHEITTSAAKRRTTTSRRRRTARLRLVIGAIGAGILCVAAVVIAVKSTRRAPDVSARVLFDREGRPRAELWCRSCEEGTSVRLGDKGASFSGGRAALELDPPVSLGPRRFDFELAQPGDRRPRALEVTTDVAWIVSADLRGLAQPVPKLAVVFDARPELGIIVDGHALAPTPTGTRRWEVEVTEDLTGAAPAVHKLSRRIPYIVTEPGARSLRGEIEISTEIVPLRVDAPGQSVVVEGTSFTLAGITQSGGTVSVEGRPITVDPSGRFAQLMSVSAIGDTVVSVRASAPGRAPRLVPIRVKRVASLDKEAEEFSARATASYSAIADETDKKLGWAVVLEGKVVETRIDGYASSVLLDVDKGCAAAPCLVWLKIGARVGYSARDRLIAYGYVAGKSADPSSGRTVPEVRVEFARGRP